MQEFISKGGKFKIRWDVQDYRSKNQCVNYNTLDPSRSTGASKIQADPRVENEGKEEGDRQVGVK